MFGQVQEGPYCDNKRGFRHQNTETPAQVSLPGPALSDNFKSLYNFSICEERLQTRRARISLRREYSLSETNGDRRQRVRHRWRVRRLNCAVHRRRYARFRRCDRRHW